MKVVVITGASGGIGAQTASIFADRGYTVYGLSRSPGNDKRVNYIPTDVSDVSSVMNAFSRIAAKHEKLDILINNAGMGISGALELTKTEDAKWLFDVNFFGALNCIKSAVPMMRKCGGRIVNISSVAAVFSIPFQSFYSASKAAVNSMTMALRGELKRFGISVCAVLPGDAATGFTGARVKSEEGALIYGGSIERSVAVMEKDERNGMTPQYVALRIYKAATKRKVRPFYTVGIKYKVFCVLSKVLPAGFISTVVGGMYVK